MFFFVFSMPGRPPIRCQFILNVLEFSEKAFFPVCSLLLTESRERAPLVLHTFFLPDSFQVPPFSGSSPG